LRSTSSWSLSLICTCRAPINSPINRCAGINLARGKRRATQDTPTADGSSTWSTRHAQSW
jgi:hypothetical protein